MVTVSVFLPSHNKPEYVMDAINCLLAQTFPDWEVWIVENSTDGVTRDVIKSSGVLDDPRVIYTELNLAQKIREKYYPAAWLMNRFYPCANGRYIFFLADDDLIDPECFELCVKDLDSFEDHHIVYFGRKVVGIDPPGSEPCFINSSDAMDIIPRLHKVEYVLDGGQIMHSTSCLSAYRPPYFPEDVAASVAGHCDGAFLKKLSAYFDFHPIPGLLLTHRYTPKSTWTKYEKGRVSNWIQQGKTTYKSGVAS